MATVHDAPATHKRTLRWEPVQDDFGPVCGRLTLTVDGTATTYTVEEFSPGWSGRGFQLTKRGGSATYSVFVCNVSKAGDRCECGDATFRGNGADCKHSSALRALIKRGKL